MGTIISQFITEWGTLGAVIFLIGWFAYENWKSNKAKAKESKYNSSLIDDIKHEIQTEVGHVNTSVANLHDFVDSRIDIMDSKIDNVEKCMSDRIDILSDRIDMIPADSVAASRKQNEDDANQHLKQIQDVMLLGREMHVIMKKYTELTHADHMFIGSFHNGTTNLTGIPFCKFDIISECYCENKVEQDHEFAPVYKDADILRYGSLFSVLFQNEYILCKVDPDGGDNEMAKYEDIIWRRMYGLGIKQIAVHILRDPSNSPSGFLGIVRYDDEPMNMSELHICAKELEHIYSVNKYKQQDAYKE